MRTYGVTEEAVRAGPTGEGADLDLRGRELAKNVR